jgi:diguanylate cyclase (GGDEF)-like protein
MGFEGPKQYTQEQIEAMNEERRRVAKLRETDSKYDDSVVVIAQAENELRGKMTADGLPHELADKYGDIHSTVVLEKIEAEKEKWIDGLTGLRNKKALLEGGPKLLSIERPSLAETERRKNGENVKKKNCAFIMLDFDDFRNVNSDYGHSGGDDALKAMAKIIGANLREQDYLYRAGGEEFAIFLPHTDLKAAEQVAEKVRRAVEKALIEVRDNEGESHGLKRTISLGCTDTEQIPEWLADPKEFPDSKILEILTKKADAALYVSKKSGKNQVTVYQEGIEESQA